MVEFQNFTDNQFVGCIRNNQRYVTNFFVNDAAHGLRKHIVANQHGHLRTPFAMGCLLPAANVRAVNDVVVHEACEVQKFYGRTGVCNAVNIRFLRSAVCEQAKERRTDALAFATK